MEELLQEMPQLQLCIASFFSGALTRHGLHLQQVIIAPMSSICVKMPAAASSSSSALSRHAKRLQ